MNNHQLSKNSKAEAASSDQEASSQDQLLLNEVLIAINKYIQENAKKLRNDYDNPNVRIINQITDAIYNYANQKVPRKLINNTGRPITSYENLTSNDIVYFSMLKKIEQTPAAFKTLIDEINKCLGNEGNFFQLTLKNTVQSKFLSTLRSILNKGKVKEVHKALDSNSELSNSNRNNNSETSTNDTKKVIGKPTEATEGWDLLPEEVKHNILYYVDDDKYKSTIQSLKQTSRLFYHLVTSDDDKKWSVYLMKEFPHLNTSAIQQLLEENGHSYKNVYNALRGNTDELAYCVLKLAENYDDQNQNPIRILNAKLYTNEDLNRFIQKSTYYQDEQEAKDVFNEFSGVVILTLRNAPYKIQDMKNNSSKSNINTNSDLDLRQQVVAISIAGPDGSLVTTPAKFNGEIFVQSKVNSPDISNNNNNNNNNNQTKIRRS